MSDGQADPASNPDCERPSDRDVEDGVAPPWRFQECVKDQYAVQRVLEVVRGEDGKFYLLLEYLGYRYLEVRLECLLVDKNSEPKLAGL